MLIRITTQCQMQCSHCFVDAKPKGQMVNAATFVDALEWSAALDPLVLLTGGEPTEHHDVVPLIYQTKRKAPVVGLLSNGAFLSDSAKTEGLLATGVTIQVTNDPRFYPRGLPRVLEHPQISYAYRVPTLIALGRWRGPSTRIAPGCYNLRSLTRHLGSLANAIRYLRANHKFCTPSVDPNGTIRAGESPLCYPVGTVWDSDRALTEKLLAHDCDRCGLHSELSRERRETIGLSS